MSTRMTRRDALKLATSTAISAAATPILSSPLAMSAARPATDEICFMRAVDMVEAIRTRKIRYGSRGPLLPLPARPKAFVW